VLKPAKARQNQVSFEKGTSFWTFLSSLNGILNEFLGKREPYSSNFKCPFLAFLGNLWVIPLGMHKKIGFVTD
jgi:hypothetical protein